MAANAFFEDLKVIAESVATQVSATLLQAYLAKATGTAAPGTPALTLGNIGTLSGVISAATVLQHIAATAPTS